jgi:hypothetical protein
MTTGCWFQPDDSPLEFSNHQWNHSSSLTSHMPLTCSIVRPWASIVEIQQGGAWGRHRSTPKNLSSPRVQKRKLSSSDHGSFGSGCGVRRVGNTPPPHYEFNAQPSPQVMENQSEVKRDLRWLREHIILTSKHLPGRAPLPDKGKPVVRRGRKATGQISDLTAGLPEEE